MDLEKDKGNDASKAMARHIEDMEENPFLPAKGRKKRIAAIVAGVIALALVGGGIAYAVNSHPEAEPAKAETVAKEETAPVETPSAERAEVGTVKATVVADGYDPETSTPVSLAVYAGDVRDRLANDDGDDDPRPLDEVSCDANEAVEIECLREAGTYTVAVTAAPILADGTVYEACAPQVVELADRDIDLAFDCTAMDLEKASEEEVAAATEAAERAAGNSGSDSAAAAAAAATKKAGERASSAKSESKSKPSSSGGDNSGSNGGSGNAGGSAPTTKPAPSPSSGSNGSGSNGGSDSNASGNSETAPARPAHTHDWVAQTKTVHHDAEYKTVHHDAVTEEVTICNVCGAVNPGYDHMKAHALAGEGGSTYNEVRVVRDAYDEQVLVTAAWDETVTTGWKCSGCGKTK